MDKRLTTVELQIASRHALPDNEIDRDSLIASQFDQIVVKPLHVPPSLAPKFPAIPISYDNI